MRSALHTRIVLCTLLLFIPHATFAQGPLTPPGAPAPTMKSLDQVEPRIAITNLPILINQPGSYYLTQSFAQTFSSAAISIATSNVTLDLCGFTVQEVGPSPVDGMSIQCPQLSVPIKNVLVKNGIITGFPSGTGIFTLGARNCVIENLAVTKCANGITFEASGTAGAVGNVVRHCRICDNTGSGVAFASGAANIQNVIIDCDSLNNTSAGFAVASAGNWVANCRASGNANNYVIGIGNREGSIVQPTTNSVAFNGASGALGTGATDPAANLSY